ncbi:MAG TPA: hypothetical protein VFT74_13695 [Isosphaeraceae bacterium]|nr:hypothetical protein [Isosphaeraceae bacterium]
MNDLRALLAVLGLFGLMGTPGSARSSWIWVEGETPVRSSMHRHPFWYDQVRKEQLSGGGLISNFHEQPGEATYSVKMPKDGSYAFWVRANPVQSSLSYRVDGGDWTPITLDSGTVDTVNIAADSKIDLRFLAWAKVGDLKLSKGDHVFAFRMDSKNQNHGYLDCFMLTDEPFQPAGARKPDQQAAAARELEKQNEGWFAFPPPADRFDEPSAINLRDLNESRAGDNGRIVASGSEFVYFDGGKPIRFWAVNGPLAKDRDGLKREARLLAKYGVNLVRIHHGYFDQDGQIKPEEVQHAIETVEALKNEGIYSHFSIYFPLWLSPKPGTDWLPGYDGKMHPFAALFFNKDFQTRYREWWKALLLTPDPATGHRLIDDPAVFGLEIQNEDSYFFWTFDRKNIPDPELRIIEAQFGAWAAKKYGSIDKALESWKGEGVPRDNVREGRLGFRPLWNIFNQKTPRDQDTARFLFESQKHFYEETYRFLRDLGFKGLITASNWTTASPEVLGPLEKASYSVTDFIDRHGYFGGVHKGDNSAWSIRNGHVYADRSALRFDPPEPGKPRVFEHPVMDPSYDGKPSMISETTFTRPNRYRSEAPLFYAAYGALQDSDAIVHFAFDGSNWSVKPGYFMQPWTVNSPAMMGQFPAAARLYRLGLVEPGALLVDLKLNLDDLLALEGTPLPQGASLDELRLKDVPATPDLNAGEVIDPLVHFAGRTNVNILRQGGVSEVEDLSRFIHREKQVVESSTGQLRLDYDKGLLTINAPKAQGASGNLKAGGKIDLNDLTITSPMDLGHIIAISLDGHPLKTSKKILLQVMSEEKPSGFQTEPAENGLKRIVSIGRDPWLVKEFAGSVSLKRPDAKFLTVMAIEASGAPGTPAGDASGLSLQPRTLYYLITP